MQKLLTTFAALLIAASTSFAGDFKDIELADLKAAIADKSVTVIDVNGTESYKEGHIPGAIDYTEVKGELASKLPADKDALIVAYCGSEKCGAYKRAAKEAKEAGYTNVQHFKPGLAGWKAAGEELEK